MRFRISRYYVRVAASDRCCWREKDDDGEQERSTDERFC